MISQEALEFYAAGTTDHHDACDMARELFAARKVIEAARRYVSWVEGGMRTPGLPELVKLEDAMVSYDEATR